MATDEDPYFNKSSRMTKNLDYITDQHHAISKDNTLMVEELSLAGLDCKFEWCGIKQKKQKESFEKEGKYAWLKPIRL